MLQALPSATVIEALREQVCLHKVHPFVFPSQPLFPHHVELKHAQLSSSLADTRLTRRLQSATRPWCHRLPCREPDKYSASSEKTAQEGRESWNERQLRRQAGKVGDKRTSVFQTLHSIPFCCLFPRPLPTYLLDLTEPAFSLTRAD